MATVEEINAKLTALIQNLSPQARRTLAKNIGQKLRQRQQARIARQQNPDGSAYEPRKQQKLRKKTGRVKRKAMFTKLRTARFLKVRSNSNEITVGFSGNNAKIAEIHQYGLKGRVQRQREYKVQYAQRELLGFADEDIQMIEDYVIKALGDGL
ncbi:MAG: phage virion morphogenesis protein [[Pasteurella] mairii]|nr:phage virion morphogenesis protein [[Pasteurella] mairii]